MEVGEDKKFDSKLCFHKVQLAFVSILLPFLVMVLWRCKVLRWKRRWWNKPTCVSFIVWYEAMCSKDADFLKIYYYCVYLVGLLSLMGA